MALIPPFFLDCVVAIGKQSAKGERLWIASGFLYAYYLGPGLAGGEKSYRVFLISNRHVFADQDIPRHLQG